MDQNSPPRHAAAALLGAALGAGVASLFTLGMRDKSFEAWQLFPIFAIAGALGGGVVGLLLASWVRPSSEAYPKRRLLLMCLGVPVLGGAAGGALLLFLTVWTFQNDAGFVRALEAGGGGALLGVVVGVCSLPISAPLVFFLIRALRKP